MNREEFDQAMRDYGNRMKLPEPSPTLLDLFWEYFQEVGMTEITFLSAALDRCVQLREHYEGWAPPAFILDKAKLHAWSIGSDLDGMTA